MLLPPQFHDPPLKTLGPPIRKAEENKPKEVKVRDGIYRVNGKLETRFPENVLIDTLSTPAPLGEVSEVDIPLPKFKVEDRVRIIGGGSREGDVGVIENISGDYWESARHTMIYYCVVVDGRFHMACKDGEIERA